MVRKRLIIYAAIPIVMLLIAAISGFSQENMQFLDDSAFAVKMRPPALFPHDAHNEKANIITCDTCHHLYENGKKVEGVSSEDRQCSECHHKDGDPMQLASAYHNRCKGCHIEKKAGPVLCGECHKK